MANERFSSCFRITILCFHDAINNMFSNKSWRKNNLFLCFKFCSLLYVMLRLKNKFIYKKKIIDLLLALRLHTIYDLKEQIFLPYFINKNWVNFRILQRFNVFNWITTPIAIYFTRFGPKRNFFTRSAQIKLLFNLFNILPAE